MSWEVAKLDVRKDRVRIRSPYLESRSKDKLDDILAYLISKRVLIDYDQVMSQAVELLWDDYRSRYPDFPCGLNRRTFK